MANPAQQQQRITINDFTSGVVSFSRGSYLPTFSAMAPLGSASLAFRCYAVPGVGLCPFPSYVTTVSDTIASSANGSWIGSCSIKSIGVKPTALNNESLMYANMFYDGANTHFGLTQYTAAGSTISGSTARYSNSVAGNMPFETPNIVQFFFVNSGVTSVVSDPLRSTNIAAEFICWDLNTLQSGSVAGTDLLDTAKLMVQSSRLVFITVETYATGNTFTAYRITTPPQALFGVSTFSVNEFEPSQVLSVGSWGSMDAGECFFIGQSGGGLYISGDIFAPSSVIKLPGVASTGVVIGPAALCADGYVYVTDTGAYVWNGGNTSTKISGQIPDDVLYRTSGFIFNPVPVQRPNLTHHDVWADWVMFANNWMFDTITHSWWQVEDPAIIQTDLHCQSSMSPRYFYSKQGYIQNTSGGAQTIQLHFYAWDRNVPQSNWQWISNPIPTTIGSLTNLDEVEIVASNPSSTSCTITVTPQVPPGQTPIGGNNQQSVLFTIPPNSVSVRQKQRLGYNDYNIQIGIVAANSNANNEGPILHEISIGYSNISPSSVQ